MMTRWTEDLKALDAEDAANETVEIVLHDHEEVGRAASNLAELGATFSIADGNVLTCYADDSRSVMFVATPRNGVGGTRFIGGDAHPFTVLNVVDDGLVEVVLDGVERVNSTSELVFTRRFLEGKILTVSRRKCGGWYEVGVKRGEGCVYSFGTRMFKRDPEF